MLAISRTALCLMPQNAWQSAQAPLSWGIYRNIPFTLLGALIVVMFYRSTKEKQDKSFRFLWLAVVLFADAVPAVGMLIFFGDRPVCGSLWSGKNQHISCLSLDL